MERENPFNTNAVGIFPYRKAFVSGRF
jgi:hypothetical protein